MKLELEPKVGDKRNMCYQMDEINYVDGLELKWDDCDQKKSSAKTISMTIMALASALTMAAF